MSSRGVSGRHCTLVSLTAAGGRPRSFRSQALKAVMKGVGSRWGMVTPGAAQHQRFKRYLLVRPDFNHPSQPSRSRRVRASEKDLAPAATSWSRPSSSAGAARRCSKTPQNIRPRGLCSRLRLRASRKRRVIPPLTDIETDWHRGVAYVGMSRARNCSCQRSTTPVLRLRALDPADYLM